MNLKVVQQISPLARGNAYKRIYSTKTTGITVDVTESHVRRSTNYEPSSWSFDHIQSLSRLSEETMIRKAGNLLRTLELVDELQRLGMSYLFEEEIIVQQISPLARGNAYKRIYSTKTTGITVDVTESHVRRSTNYEPSSWSFDHIQSLSRLSEEMMMRKAGNLLRTLELVDELQRLGMSYLFEEEITSYHSFEDESILDDARDITTKYLKESLEKIDGSILSLVSHALEQPLHWRVPRVESKWFIEAYGKRGGASPILIELAKLDFDMVQVIHLEDSKHASRYHIFPSILQYHDI
ncbi:R-linalool synthase QH5, chloroplastic [Artemisia annua]|uniref:R-linalool synthase QH5, chloroplastic n=1 Tax=Artemisia annua TaxID=35608 RepID=A0A2U1L0L3_ARTAN|nr:R-linalool synthase QH5, chloroplastic [Artemisia annua]